MRVIIIRHGSAANEPEKPSRDRSAAADYYADWESLASDTEEHMDGKAAKHDVDAEANRSSSSGNENVGTIPTASQSELSDFREGRCEDRGKRRFGDV